MFGSLVTNLEEVIAELASFIAVLVEFIGVFIIIFAIVKFIYRMIKVHKFDLHEIHKDKTLNVNLSVALEVLLAAEILKTLTLHGDFSNLIEVVLLIVVRLLMSIVLRFENKA